ncbi:hypothetical protein COV82_03020 [Candidatus Peregrinibacteria bacterium CG11_big_fil_rev_8_21_14_0_20_46_8]|nr:MAG: hypothetical protein COV82_03020 [Candidatus Peregrinibacteria bacterium CG11_big_fil_rev_8_21_14_0_20_46_8]
MKSANITVQKICAACSAAFELIAQELEFYAKRNLPRPQNCPACRQKRRLALRNERTLYRRACDGCKLEMISSYPPDSKYTIFCSSCFVQVTD